MMNRRTAQRWIPCATALLAACCFAATAERTLAFQQVGGPAGHWVGTIAAGPGIEVEVDLAAKGEGWYGTFSVPSQGTRGLPLADLTVKEKAVSFAIKGGPGDPQFSGTLSEDGKTISGTFTQGGASLPLSLVWKGEPKFEVAQKSAPVTKDLEGSWEGSLDVKGTVLRLVLKLANGPEGATGTLVSLDQGNIEIPVATITQDGSRLKLLVTMISGTFDGELKGGELAGTWTQGQLSLPLVFKKGSGRKP
jgi:hypothetical protein